MRSAISRRESSDGADEIVIPIEMFCLPGKTRRANGPMMMPASSAPMIVQASPCALLLLATVSPYAASTVRARQRRFARSALG